MENIYGPVAQLLMVALHPEATSIPSFPSQLQVAVYKGSSHFTLQVSGKFRLASWMLIKSLVFN